MAPAVVWVAGPAAVGVVVGTVLFPEPLALLAAVTAAWAAAVGAYRRARSPLVLAAVATGAVAAGAAIGSLDATRRLRPSLPRHVGLLAAGARTPITVEGTVRDDAVRSDVGASFTLDVSRVVVDGRAVAASGGIRVSVAGQLVGPSLDSWTRGRTLRLAVALRYPQPYRNPGVPDPRVALARRELAFLGSVKSGALVESVARAGPLAEAAASARRWVRKRVRDTVGAWSPESAAVAVAILIGDRAGLAHDIEDRLRRAGTYHVIAISGGNIAILTAWLLLMARLCRLPPRVASVATACGVTAYAVVVGSQASVLRASVVAVIYLIGLYLDLRAAPLAVTLAAAAGILAARPLWWFDPGLWLTFGAAVGILLGAARLARLAGRMRAPRPGRWQVVAPILTAGASISAATLAAEAALLPLGAFFFSRVTAAGLLLNLAAVPLMTALQVSAMAVVALSAAFPTPATWLAWIAHVCAAGILDSARLVDLAPWLTRRVPAPSVLLLAVYYAAWLAWFTARREGSRRLALAVAGAAALAVLWAPRAPGWMTSHPRDGLVSAVRGLERARGPLLSTVFLDVGQGDAAAITFPDGRSWLVDAGGQTASSGFDVGERVVAPALWAFGARRIETLVVTHGHPDHAGGAPAIIDDFRPREVWQGVPAREDPALDVVRAHAARAGAALVNGRASQRTDRGGVSIRVLHPPSPEWERRRVRNDDSVGLDVRLGDVSFVLTGDAGASVEPAIAAEVPPARLRILKVPHHGSRGASSQSFLARVKPALAVVSAGSGNPFGHPSAETLARYRALHIPVLRTDIDGAVWVGTDGRCVWARTFAGRQLSLGGGGCSW